MDAHESSAMGRAMEQRNGHFPTAGHRIPEDALSSVSLQPVQPPFWCQLLLNCCHAQPSTSTQAASGMPGATFGSDHRPGQAEALQTLGTLLHMPAEGSDPYERAESPEVGVRTIPSYSPRTGGNCCWDPDLNISFHGEV